MATLPDSTSAPSLPVHVTGRLMEIAGRLEAIRKIADPAYMPGVSSADRLHAIRGLAVHGGVHLAAAREWSA